MARTNVWLLSTVCIFLLYLHLPLPPKLLAFYFTNIFKWPAWMTVIKIKLQYMMVKRVPITSHSWNTYIYIRNIWAAKKIIKILHPLLVLPVNLWHDSWTERAAVSAYPKLPPPPEAQSHSLYFSKSKWLKLFILTVHSRDHPLCFYCARCLPLTLHSDPKTPGLLSHTCSRKKNPALQNFFSRSHLICIPRELITVFLLSETAAISANPPSSQITHSENIPHFLSQKTCSGYHSTG